MNWDLLKYNVIEKPVSEVCKELLQLEEFKSTNRDNEKIIKYICVLYDPNTPLVKGYPRFEERQNYAIQLADLSNHVKVEQIKTLEEDRVAKMAFAFLTKIFHNILWREYIILNHELNEFTQLRIEPIKKDDKMDDKKVMEAAEKKGKLRQQCTEIINEIARLEEKIFGKDETLVNYVKKRFSTPEQVMNVQTIR
jgi:hypothetical protein